MATTKTADMKVGQSNSIEHLDAKPSRTKQTGIVGLAFALIYVMGLLAAFPTPTYDAPDAEWTEWFADSGNRVAAIVGLAVIVLAGLTLLWFTSLLVTEVRRRRGAFGTVDSLAMAAGSAAAVSAIVGAVLGSAISIALVFEPGVDVAPSAEMLKSLEFAGLAVIMIGAGWCQAVFLVAAGVAARNVKLLPDWLTTAGFFAAVVLLASPAYFPMLVFPLWVLVASIVLMRTDNARI